MHVRRSCSPPRAQPLPLRQAPAARSPPAASTREARRAFQGLKAAILAKVKARLDQAVSSKRLTAAQEQMVLDRLSAHLDQLLDRARAGATT